MRRLLMLTLCATVAASNGADLEPHAGLAGSWTIDDERSDSSGRRLNSALGAIVRDLRPPPRNERSDPTIRRAASRSELARDLFGPIRLPGRTLTIDVEADAVTLARTESLHGAGVDTEALADGRFPAFPRLREAERIFTDGRQSVVDADNPDVRQGAWEDGVLWIERNGARGTRVVEAWRREGSTLRIDFEVRNALLKEPVIFTLHYARPEAPTP